MAFGDFVQGSSKDAGTVNSTTLLVGTITAGNTIVVGVRRGGNVADTVTVSDNVNAGNYTQDGTTLESADPHGDYFFRMSNASAGATTLTVTFTGVAKTMRIVTGEYVGSFALHGTPAQATGSSASPSSGNQTTTLTAAIIGVVSTANVGTSYASTGGMTLREDASVNHAIVLQDANGQQVAGSYAASATLGTVEAWGATVLAYVAAPAAAGSPAAFLNASAFILGGTGPRFRPTVTLGDQTLAVPGLPVPNGVVVSQAVRRPYANRQTVPAPHLAKPIVAPGGPVPVPNPVPVVILQALRRPFIGRTTPAPHLAPANLSPKRFAPAVVIQARLRALLGRNTPKPHLPSAIVAPGGPVSVVVPPHAIVVDQALPRALTRRTTPAPHTAPPVVPQPVVTVPPFAPAVVVLQSIRRALAGRTPPRPHVPPTNLAHTPFAPAVVVAQAIRRALLGRTTPKPHTAPPVVPQPAATTPPLSPAVVVSQGERRPAVGRTVPNAHLAKPIVAPGGPVPVVTPVCARVTSQALRRAALGRTTPRPHTAPPIVPQPAATVPPFPPAVVVSQAARRALIGRTTSKPHLAPVNLRPAPFPPAYVVAQAVTRSHRRPPPPRPHVAPANLSPKPFAPAVIVAIQAGRRALLGRTCPHPQLARSLVAPPPVFTIGVLTAQTASSNTLTASDTGKSGTSFTTGDKRTGGPS